ncbi:MAG: hypothetical protein MI866_07920 [Bacteroidales bacterium]|nr:hypothetical protein [Bacteroidales bacterium]
MKVSYRLIPRRNPGKPEAKPKQYATIVRPAKVTLDELASRIAEISPVNELDTKTALMTLARVVPEYLAKGATVELGDIGRLMVNLSSAGAETEEDFSNDMIKGCKVSYRPGIKVYKALKNVEKKKG